MLLVFTFFLVAAATAGIVISILMSLGAAGGFLAVLFAFLAAMYVGLLSVAVIVISATTVATVIAITIATGTSAHLRPTNKPHSCCPYFLNMMLSKSNHAS
jgi:hypothetical protein